MKASCWSPKEATGSSSSRCALLAVLCDDAVWLRCCRALASDNYRLSTHCPMYSAYCLTIGVQFHFKCLGKRGADNKSPPYGFTFNWLLENLHPDVDESQHIHIRMYLQRFDKGSKKRLKSNQKLRSAFKTLQDDTLLTGKLIDYFDFLDGSVRLLGQSDQDQAQVPQFALIAAPTAALSHPLQWHDRSALSHSLQWRKLLCRISLI
jgi:hypothetical protein